MLKFYARFEISEETGNPLTDHDMTQLHYAKITSLQVRETRPDFPRLYIERSKMVDLTKIAELLLIPTIFIF